MRSLRDVTVVVRLEVATAVDEDVQVNEDGRGHPFFGEASHRILLLGRVRKHVVDRDVTIFSIHHQAGEGSERLGGVVVLAILVVRHPKRIRERVRVGEPVELDHLGDVQRRCSAETDRVDLTGDEELLEVVGDIEAGTIRHCTVLVHCISLMCGTERTSD